MCSAVDSVGNSGEATWQIANVTGKNYSLKDFSLQTCVRKSDPLVSHIQLQVAVPLVYQILYNKK